MLIQFGCTAAETSWFHGHGPAECQREVVLLRWSGGPFRASGKASHVLHILEAFRVIMLGPDMCVTHVCGDLRYVPMR